MKRVQDVQQGADDNVRGQKAARGVVFVSNAVVIPDDEDNSKQAMANIVKKGSGVKRSPTPDKTVSSNLKQAAQTIPELLFEGMQSDNADMVSDAVNQLAECFKYDPYRRADAIQQGAHAILVAALKGRWRQNESIVASCFQALVNLLSPEECNHEIRLILLWMGLSAFVTKALRDYPECNRVQCFGFHLLKRLFHRNDPKTSHDVDQFLVVDRGLSLITNAMTRNRHRKGLQYAGCLLLTKLCSDFGTAKNLALQSNAVGVVTNSVQRYRTVKVIQKQGREFLRVMDADVEREESH